jgi:hypothetical protein
MKIKLDFITNSSSTAFVVLIPNKFYADENEIQKFYDRHPYDELTDEQLLKELPEYIETLKEGDNIWYYGGDGANQTLWSLVIDICDKHKFTLASLDMNGEGNNIIQGIKEEQIEELLINNIDIISMFKMIQRESTNVTEKTE